jgi:hypothetical protein
LPLIIKIISIHFTGYLYQKRNKEKFLSSPASLFFASSTSAIPGLGLLLEFEEFLIMLNGFGFSALKVVCKSLKISPSRSFTQFFLHTQNSTQRFSVATK